ncbi:chloride channel protein [Albibacterium bauzanense]|uniref:CIC family chloride channel protein n=1 Tax=Albibacterium bauzanense TaxID=653929 RepID=A0A4R1LZR2_9SPHI|nr:chloride channel protein [Albibacterium bauzanense]TCK85096.1 CIC family chloride channel protein [Albibacterium bauzanense]
MIKEITTFVNRLNQWRIQRISNRSFLIILAAIVGITGGLAASALKALTLHIATFLQNEVPWELRGYLYLFFPLIGIFLSVLYVRKFLKTKKMDHGITPILYSISNKSSRIPVHNVYSQIITSALTVGFGGSAGLEAPIVASGSAIGSNIGRFFGLNYREVTMLLACGAAAGIAGAFNSPVAGMVFAIEILLPEFSIPAFIPLLIAAATSSVVSRLLYSEPLFYLVTDTWAFDALIFYVLLALCVGLFSVFFNKLNHAAKGWFGKMKNQYHKLIISGLVLGVMVFIFPALYGEGYLAIQELLAGKSTSLLGNSLFSEYQNIGWLVLIYAIITVFAKAYSTVITLHSGGNGGNFGPSLVMGGILGFAFAYGINLTGFVELNVANFIVAGMAGALSGIMHAPLTGIFLIAEITGGYALMVPLMIVSAITYFINKSILKYSIYTQALAESGDYLPHEDKDRTVLKMMKLRYVLERNFTVLHPNEKPMDRRLDILHTKRNIFPVVDDNQVLVGIIYSEKLFEILIGEASPDKTMKELAQPPQDVIRIDTNMYEVMRKMDREDIWILPVIDLNDKYLGFVSKSAIFNKYRALLMRIGNYLE